MDTQRLAEFIELTHKYRGIQRAIDIKGGTRPENDLEHAAQVALLALFLNNKDNLDLDPYRLLGLSLVHDLVEVHAGDTYLYGDQVHIASQANRESEAVSRLRRDWPDFPELHRLIAEYEALETSEAQFVYSLDKLVPMLNNYTDAGRSWRQKGITFDEVKAAKTGNADRSPAVAPYFERLLTELEASPILFSSPADVLSKPKNGKEWDKYHLMRAREMAAGSAEQVGCGAVIVRDGRVLAEAANSQRTDNQAVFHAEIKAIMTANQVTGDRTLLGATAYCSCEPCAMCLTALANAKVGRIVYDRRMADLFPNDRQAKFDAKAFVSGLNFVPRLEHWPLAH